MNILQIFMGLVGAGLVLILFKYIDNYLVNKNQKKLEDIVSDIKQKQAGIEGAQAQEDKETQGKVDEINKEQADKPANSNLADWFDKRK